MHPLGLEPRTTVPKTVVISVSLRVQYMTLYIISLKNQLNLELLSYMMSNTRPWFSGRTRPCQGWDGSPILPGRTKDFKTTFISKRHKCIFKTTFISPKRHSKRHYSKRQCRFELDKKLNTVDNSGGNGYNYVVLTAYLCPLFMSFWIPNVVYKCRFDLSLILQGFINDINDIHLSLEFLEKFFI